MGLMGIIGLVYEQEIIMLVIEYRPRITCALPFYITLHLLSGGTWGIEMAL